MTAQANTGASRTATVSVSANGIATNIITVTQQKFTPMLHVTATPLKVSGANNSKVTVSIASNSNWKVTSSQPWLSLSSSTGNGNGMITCTASGNTGAIRSAVLSFSETGINDTTITISQADSIVILKPIADTTIATEALANKYMFAHYFSYNGSGTLSYLVSSDNIVVVSPILSGNSFGLVQYSAGSAHISVQAISSSGIVSSIITFKVTVTSQTSSNCASLSVNSSIINVTCTSESTGSVAVTVSGGVKPYNYKWSNTRSDNQIINMPAGTYSVIITDSNACSLAKSYIITEPAKVVSNATIIAPKCGSNDGSISLAIAGGTSPYSYMWNDGSLLTTITGKSAGQYTVTITDNARCNHIESFNLSNTNAPVINLDSVVSSKCTSNNGKIAITITGGTSPYIFNWSDGVLTEDRSSVASGNYSLTVNDAADCKAMFKTTVSSKTFVQPFIALVTVSDKTGKNLIVWQKENTSAIKEYTIYRETVKAGTYEKLNKVLYSDSSIYEDATANSQEQSWRYKISATDFCGNESPMSVEHKTIHLQKNIGLSKEINLDWDAYEGINFYTYSIYRNSKLKGMELIKRIPSSITRYTDLTPPNDVTAYYVSIELPDTIYPKRLKADSGPFSQSLSNLAESKFVDVALQTPEVVTISPNPAKDFVVVSISTNQPLTVDVVDVLGREVAAQSGTGSVKFDCSTFGKGLYIVKVLSGGALITRTLVVE